MFTEDVKNAENVLMNDQSIDAMERVGLHYMLDLSTRHINWRNGIDWGELRANEHEYGWVVFLPEKEAEGIPAWFAPIMEHASRFDCMIVNFDRDADVIDGLPMWDW